jgi:hypothetical protein
MVLIFFLLPFLSCLVSVLILWNAGRNMQEKFSIFLFTPENIDRDSANLISILRTVFWITLIITVWMGVYICRKRVTF